MNSPWIQTFRLAPRGGGGLACDKAGVALGAVELARARSDPTGRRGCDVRSRRGLERILNAAYGPQPEDFVLRVHRGLRRAASAIEADELCLAGIETVLLRLPDPTPSALAKLADIAALEKGGTSWEDQPRAPAGQSDGGQWTTEGSAGGGADAGRAARIVSSASRQAPEFALDDGVYRPDFDAPRVLIVGGAEEEEARPSNGPPEDFTRLEDVFPGLRETPVLGSLLAPVDGLLGVGALAEEANLQATLAQYRALVADIKRIDPTFVDNELLPSDGIAGLTWQGRTNLINGLRMQRAVAYYRILGDIGPLQVETLRFLQDAVDAAYAEAVSAADGGRLRPRLSREEAIGNRVDFEVRDGLKEFLDDYGIPFGPDQDVIVNNRDYETSASGQRYRIPDARIGDVAFDWTLSPKTLSFPQVRGFFRADSQPRAVVIIRPSSSGTNNTYLIPRPFNIRN